MRRSGLQLIISALLLCLIPLAALAQNAGEPCQRFGQTIQLANGIGVLACLRQTQIGDVNAPLVWKLNTDAPRLWMRDGGTGPDPAYVIGPEHKAGE